MEIINGNRFSLMLTTPVAHKLPGEQIVSGGDLTPGEGVTSIVSDGYYNGTRYDTSDKVILETTQNAGYYKITSSGYGSVNRSLVTKETTKEGIFFEEGAIEEIPAASIESDTATKEYFIKKSTLSDEEVSPSDYNYDVTISSGYYPTNRTVRMKKITPAYPTTDVESINMLAYFYPSNSRDYDVKITPIYSNSAGYVVKHEAYNNGGIEYYRIIPTEIYESSTTINNGSVTRGSASWNAGWIEQGFISPAVFSSTPTNGVSYVDISDTSEVPVLDDYLYINAGYVDNLRINLSKLTHYNGNYEMG